MLPFPKIKSRKSEKSTGQREKRKLTPRGKIVAPGFIDIHNHSDGYWQIFLDPQLPSLVYQGITTIVGGNCGASIAPLTDGKIIESIQKWADIKRSERGLAFDGRISRKNASEENWVSISELWSATELCGGESSVTKCAGWTEANLMICEKALERSLDEGALGFSAGLAYSHEKEATWDELVELAEIVKSSDRVFSLHLRNEAEGYSCRS